LTKGGAQPGDVLILSKPLGTGLITTAHKFDKVEAGDLDAAIRSMMQLNREASEVLQRPGVHALTDITGFGLLGHGWEMASQSLTGMRIFFDNLPLLPGARHYAELGCITGGAYRNSVYLAPHVSISERIDAIDREILWDPQTSGGLFAAIDAQVWDGINSTGMFWRIGEVTGKVENEIQVVLEVV
jgi:selenide,water dikinase